MSAAVWLLAAGLPWVVAVSAARVRRALERELDTSLSRRGRDPATGLLCGDSARRRVAVEQQTVDRLGAASSILPGRIAATAGPVAVARQLTEHAGPAHLVHGPAGAVLMLGRDVGGLELPDIQWLDPIVVEPGGDAVRAVETALGAQW